MYFNNLGISMQSRFDHLGELVDLNAAMQLFKNSALSPIITPYRQFESARHWIRALQSKKSQFPDVDMENELLAHKALMDLLPQVIWLGSLEIQRRYTDIKDTVRDSIIDAAAAAIEDKDHDTFGMSLAANVKASREGFTRVGKYPTRSSAVTATPPTSSTKYAKPAVTCATATASINNRPSLSIRYELLSGLRRVLIWARKQEFNLNAMYNVPTTQIHTK
jgi:hypothetical protein